VKTGYIHQSGKCYIGSASMNGWQLIAVVLDSHDMYKESLILLHYGFSRFQWKNYADPWNTCAQTPVSLGASPSVPIVAIEKLGAPVPRPEFGGGMLDDRLIFCPENKRLRAPVRQGQTLGRLQLRREGHLIAETSAIARCAVSVAWWTRALAGLAYTLLALLGLFIIGTIYGTIAKIYRRRRRRLQASRRNVDHGRASNGQW
jgi:D-alanyl-D-alanine carboxypeptidase (penicillin-binding protein 5/6)